VLKGQVLIILSLAQVCRDEHNLDCWFELEEQVMLVIVVGSCSCSHMTTGSLSIGLRFVVTFQAGSQGIGYMLLFAALFVGWVDLLALR